MYPRIMIDLKKIEENTKKISSKCHANGIKVAGVTKVFCADSPIVDAYIKGGVDYLADSRVQNLKRLQNKGLPVYMLRLPMPSEASEVVEFSDISLNSEIETIRLLNLSAKEQNKTHGIILMIDLGDLREGIFNEEELFETVSKILKLKHIELAGIGTNLTCYGGVIPTGENFGKLIDYKNIIEKQYGINLSLISGGNSSSLYLLDDNKMPYGINMLRVGEAFVLGRETTYGNAIEGTYDDAFILEVEIIEVKAKPSLPIGKIGMDAFGNKPVFQDKGIMTRGICGIGRQDIEPDGLICCDERIAVVGASSDHLIVDLTNCQQAYKPGDFLRFKLTYGGLLKAFTSEYVSKLYLSDD
ncbi:MAG: ornithine racemase Orr [Eubacteriales bacterium]|nr:ornithine racemase Orr [Eubacteriales bacterium]